MMFLFNPGPQKYIVLASYYRLLSLIVADNELMAKADETFNKGAHPYRIFEDIKPQVSILLDKMEVASSIRDEVLNMLARAIRDDCNFRDYD